MSIVRRPTSAASCSMKVARLSALQSAIDKKSEKDAGMVTWWPVRLAVTAAVAVLSSASSSAWLARLRSSDSDATTTGVKAGTGGSGASAIGGGAGGGDGATTPPGRISTATALPSSHGIAGIDTRTDTDAKPPVGISTNASVVYGPISAADMSAGDIDTLTFTLTGLRPAMRTAAWPAGIKPTSISVMPATLMVYGWPRIAPGRHAHRKHVEKANTRM
mmetsp:Transcript_7213/g.21944  ORF Transcript_7213/g.21944 Transcript_7213/m.21944 type:complete len:219 (-) Transcript_7213:3413-4069(-)